MEINGKYFQLRRTSCRLALAAYDTDNHFVTAIKIADADTERGEQPEDLIEAAVTSIMSAQYKRDSKERETAFLSDVADTMAIKGIDSDLGPYTDKSNVAPAASSAEAAIRGMMSDLAADPEPFGTNDDPFANPRPDHSSDVENLMLRVDRMIDQLEQQLEICHLIKKLHNSQAA